MIQSKEIFDYNKLPFEKRKDEYEYVIARHPNKIPIVIQKSIHSKLNSLAKTKFLIPKNRTVSFFMMELRRKLNLQSEHALFLFANKNLSLPMDAILNDIYSKYKDEDGFLKIIYCEENTFG